MYSAPMVQCIFSDGLAAVSLFMEPFDDGRHTGEGTDALGATHTLAHRITGAEGDWWVTAVGEVPPGTLHTFVQNLQRRK
jgi:sigma-E factor negative regulatory protein RseB